jgi:hypothetical protein
VYVVGGRETEKELENEKDIERWSESAHVKRGGGSGAHTKSTHTHASIRLDG